MIKTTHAGETDRRRRIGESAQAVAREVAVVRRALRPGLTFFAGIARILPEYSAVTLRAALYRWGGCKIECDVSVNGNLRLLAGDGRCARRLHIGSGSLIAPNVTFILDEDITIGNNVSIGPGVTLCTASHALGPGSRRMSHRVDARAIIIGDGSWVCMQSLILPGVRLGRGCVVAAGSVVVEDVPDNVMVAGNPAQVRKSLPAADR